MNILLNEILGRLMPILIVGVIGCGCGARPSGPPRIDLVQMDMTVEQVDAVLGKPLSVDDNLMNSANVQLRAYQGDGDHWIFVDFKNGRVIRMKDVKPTSKIPI